MQVWIATVVLSIGVAFVLGVAADSTQTFTGRVSDAVWVTMRTEGSLAPADCVRACVQKGTKTRFGRWRQSVYRQHIGSSLTRRTEQAGLAASQSHGQSQWGYYFCEVGRRQIGAEET
jgi:hypothetical protein